MVLICDTGRYRILSVEDVRRRGLYVEVLAEKLEAAAMVIHMAKAIVKMPEEFLLKISRLEASTDDIVPQGARSRRQCRAPKSEK